jgi:hypothetical protein
MKSKILFMLFTSLLIGCATNNQKASPFEVALVVIVMDNEENLSISGHQTSLAELEKIGTISRFSGNPPAALIYGHPENSSKSIRLVMDVLSAGGLWKISIDPISYIETSEVSYLRARPSWDIAVATHQSYSRDFWENMDNYQTYLKGCILLKSALRLDRLWRWR